MPGSERMRPSSGIFCLAGGDSAIRRAARSIWRAGWAPRLEEDGATPIGPGYSCREQAHRFGGIALPHPMEWLAERV